MLNNRTSVRSKKRNKQFKLVILSLELIKTNPIQSIRKPVILAKIHHPILFLSRNAVADRMEITNTNIPMLKNVSSLLSENKYSACEISGMMG